MMDIIAHPGFGALLFVVLTAWPATRILKRAGHNPAFAALLLLNFALPLLGLIAICIVMCRKPKTGAA